MSTSAFRTIRIPENRAPRRLIDASFRGKGDAYGCVICGMAVAKPAFMCHVIEGGGTALHCDDESLYASDAGDLYFLPVGRDCLRRFPEMKPYAARVGG